MKFLGNISHLSNSGKLIAKSSQTPPLGAFVFDKDKKKIGKIADVFGPTKEPYISINIFRSINSKDFENSYNEDLYFSNNNKKRKGRKTRKKK
ncbi:MAG: Gar1/Naf1 family protein [Methanobrevibacter sp.]|jgi:RNA-binding protein|nr:Gar1/Naf1 family protein [Methanobrevibacter sp.]